MGVLDHPDSLSMTFSSKIPQAINFIWNPPYCIVTVECNLEIRGLPSRRQEKCRKRTLKDPYEAQPNLKSHSTTVLSLLIKTVIVDHWTPEAPCIYWPGEVSFEHSIYKMWLYPHIPYKALKHMQFKVDSRWGWCDLQIPSLRCYQTTETADLVMPKNKLSQMFQIDL